MKKNISALFVYVSLTGLMLTVNETRAQDVANGVTPTVSHTDNADNADVLLLYRHEQEFGAVIHSEGWGINYRRCKHITGYKKRTLELEMVGLKSPKEIKTQGQANGSKGYFYGKQFTVTLLRGGWGYNKVITGKSERKGVEVRLLTLCGPEMAFAKPVYLDIFHPENVQNPLGDIQIERYDPNNPLHTPDYIMGRASYFTGFGEMNFFPGAFCKLGLSFEHGTLDDDVKLLETGITVDAFYKTIPIMAHTRNNQVYINVYLNIMFGKKWY